MTINQNNFQSSEFTSHLNIENNDRIIFSAKYGKGKTTFLKAFLKQSGFKALYLSPVNYSIVSNQDIFELIKYDILKELTLNDLLIEDTNDEGVESKINYLYKNSPKIANHIIDNLIRGFGHLDFLPGFEITKLISKVLHESYKFTKDQIEDFKKITQSQTEKLNDFQEDLQQKVGFLYEHNLISRIIENFITKARMKKEKIALVIDDLDRLDPEHIFRILNVFASHCDEEKLLKEGEFKNNKFGFNKIIFVCDENNIRSIFHHRFGNSADFSGYFDKFFSKKIFEFNSKKEMINYFTDYLNNNETLKGKENIELPHYSKYLLSSTNSHSAFTYSTFKYKLFEDLIAPCFEDIILSLIESNNFSFRNIIKLQDLDFSKKPISPIYELFSNLLILSGGHNTLLKYLTEPEFIRDYNSRVQNRLKEKHGVQQYFIFLSQLIVISKNETDLKKTDSNKELDFDFMNKLPRTVAEEVISKYQRIDFKDNDYNFCQAVFEIDYNNKQTLFYLNFAELLSNSLRYIRDNS